MSKEIDLQFIKKSRPKLKSGDIFYYRINNKYYFGLVLLTQLDKRIEDNTAITVALPHYCTDEITEFSINDFVYKLESLDLMAPPITINKRAWWKGFFVKFTGIDYITIIENLRFVYAGKVYNSQFELCNDVPTPKLLGSVGAYGYEGVEYLIQVGLGLSVDINEAPYKYYTSFFYEKYLKSKEIPYWYYNSITGRPKLKSGDIFYYRVNNKYYFGLILLTQLDRRIEDNIVITVALPHYCTDEITEFSINDFIYKLESLDLIAPPINTNKRAWWKELFVKFTSIDYISENILENLRFECAGKVYNSKFEPCNDIPIPKLFGTAGIYEYDRVEYLIEVGLGLSVDISAPYKYYMDPDYEKYLKGKEIPYWYYNSITGIPKLKSGDIFYYRINNKYYFGLVVLTQLDKRIEDNVVITVILPHYCTDEITEFSINDFIYKLESLDLIAPPTNVNKRVWWTEFFVKFTSIDYINKNILENLRFEYAGKAYNSEFEPCNDIPIPKLFGKAGIYEYDRVVYLIQVGLGLSLDINEVPYEYSYGIF
ncbi:hypothetical protein QV06_03815 [Gallibacterium genomosp. 3]|uniref:Uncharacterized protein n=1 Tax=Gallibacterium genomosp. 3 TaxID=505345 RepID=A0A1A7PVC8_9PAST|nr:hypothetical protein [Gallibacterium genomosp. 3]OBX05115.1 hypothetical protein QV06_03815 [Gallibacterium genomosp. 3]